MTDKCRYNQTIFAKKIKENQFEELRVDDNKKTYSTTVVFSTDNINDDYDFWRDFVVSCGYKKVESYEMGERELVPEKQIAVTQTIKNLLKKLIEVGTTTTAQIQKELSCAYGVAANVIDWMIDNNYIASAENHQYTVTITQQQFEEKFA